MAVMTHAITSMIPTTICSARTPVNHTAREPTATIPS
jgi:hypothetical protein